MALMCRYCGKEVRNMDGQLSASGVSMRGASPTKKHLEVTKSVVFLDSLNPKYAELQTVIANGLSGFEQEEQISGFKRFWNNLKSNF